MTLVLIALGTNIGDRHAQLDAACDALAELPHSDLVATSPRYETDPVGPIPQEKFLNAAAAIETDLEPLRLLVHLQRIEQQAGRSPEAQRVKWGPRPLDLDLVLYGEQVISEDDLQIPHPMLHERWFVLKPLADIAPNAVHPTLEMTVAELLRNVEQGGT